MYVSNTGGDSVWAGFLGGLICVLCDSNVIVCALEKGGPYAINHCSLFYPGYLSVAIVGFLFTGLLLAIWLVALIIRKAKNG